MKANELRANARAARAGRGFSRKAVVTLATALVMTSMVAAAFASGILSTTSVTQHGSAFGVVTSASAWWPTAGATLAMNLEGATNTTCSSPLTAPLTTATQNVASPTVEDAVPLDVGMNTTTSCHPGSFVEVFSFVSAQDSVPGSNGAEKFLISAAWQAGAGSYTGGDCTAGACQSSVSVSVTTAYVANGGEGEYQLVLVLDFGTAVAPNLTALSVIVSGN